MRQEQLQLKPSEEEVVLRRVALAALRGVSATHLQHLQHLRLIEAGTSWRLTPLGQQRLKAMPQWATLLPADAYEEIERLLAKFSKPSGLTKLYVVAINRKGSPRAALPPLPLVA
jgi:hypothetical protein